MIEGFAAKGFIDKLAGPWASAFGWAEAKGLREGAGLALGLGANGFKVCEGVGAC